MRLFNFKKIDVVRLSLAVTGILLLLEATHSKEKNLLDIEYLQQCPEKEYADVESPVRDIKIYKLNRTTRALNLKFTMKRPWGPDVGFKMELDIWGYAGWTHVPYISAQPDFCKKFKTVFREISNKMIKKIDTKQPQNCPFLPGEYVVNNYTSTASPYFPFKGRFRFRVILMSMSTKQLIMCLVALLNIEEKVLD